MSRSRRETAAPGIPGDGPPIRIGISSCLLGQEVRYDGGHKKNDFAVDVLARHVEWVPVCPEVEVGLGIPRPQIHLERAPDGSARLVMPSTGEDLTDRMAAYAEDRVRRLLEMDLCGYILKKGSPTCGMGRVKLHDTHDTSEVPALNGTGLFAQALLRLAPHLPVEEEGCLNDPRLTANFMARVLACRRRTTRKGTDS